MTAQIYLLKSMAMALLLWTSPPRDLRAQAMDQVVSALKAGDAARLAEYFDVRVDIILPDKSESYNKKQGEDVLRNFFARNQVRNFVVQHQGENRGARFCIGTLQTRQGSFRTKIFLRSRGSSELVREIAFQVE